MERLHTQMQVEIKVISALHIGTGDELLLNNDLVPHRGWTYRVNENVFLDQFLARAEASGQAAVNRLLEGRPASELLSAADFDPHSSLFRYVMAGQPSAHTTGSKVREQIKDVYDGVYLPGSSLKGALRTVLAWGFYASQNRLPDLGRLGRHRTWAAQELERGIFGSDPNHDWLRAWHVEDSAACKPADSLQVLSVRVYPTAAARGGGGLDIDAETVKAGAVFHSALTVEEYGFEPEVAARLGWQGKRAWLEQLPGLARQHAEQRVSAELRYFKQPGRPAGALRFYEKLLQLCKTLTENEFVLQLGWGTGWESKTLGSGLLRKDEQVFEKLLQEYRMTKERRREPGDPFPKSRHLVLDPQGQPAAPLGWVKVKLTRQP